MIRRVLAPAGAALAAGLLAACAARFPAPLPAPRAPELRPAPGGTLRVGRSWLRGTGPGEGVLVGRLEGEPRELGLALGRLGRSRMAAQEAHLHRLFAEMMPGDLKRALVLGLLRVQMRGLAREIPPDIVRSIVGLADGYEPVTPPGRRPARERVLGLHALHDVSQRFVDAPALAAACTGFVAAGSGTRDGRVLLARNFDFEGGALFDRQKVVWVAAPAGKIPHLSVGFSGMLGVTSGFNREGIGVAINAISGGETGTSGAPITLVLLDVLQNARTLEEAVERIRRARVFVSDLVFVAEAATGRAVVVEKSPGAVAVREMGPEGLLPATNEPESPAIRASARPLPAGSTSRKRRARLDELLRLRAPLDVPGAAAILRDREGVGGVPLGPGNRNAIDGLIAAHSVVLDLSARRAWVAAAPHTLGAFVPVDLEAVLADAEGVSAVSSESPLPEDPFLSSGGWDRYRAARGELLGARALSSRGEWAAARERAERAHALSPGFVEATGRLAEACARLGEKERALALLGEALARDPAPAPFREGLEALRRALVSGAPLPPPEAIPSVVEPDELLELAR